MSESTMLDELKRIAALLPHAIWNHKGVLVWSALDGERLRAVIANADAKDHPPVRGEEP